MAVTAVPRVLQVFEYLTTDLKKYMDRSGKGPNYPLPKTTIKVTKSVVYAANTANIRCPVDRICSGSMCCANLALPVLLLSHFHLVLLSAAAAD